CDLHCFFLRLRTPPRLPLFPYTTLFRSADGVNKEQTTAYQQFVASLFIVAGLAARRTGLALERDYWTLVERMIEFLFAVMDRGRSEEHTSELQSRENLVCRLLLEKKKKT